MSSPLSFEIPPALVNEIAERVADLIEQRNGSSPEPWVDVKAAAEHLACKPQRIYDLCGRRDETRLPHRKDGSRLLFRLSELDSYLGGI